MGMYAEKSFTEPWIMSILRAFARENMKVVQLGCWYGDETNAMANIIRYFDGELIVIDWFKGQINIKDKDDQFYTEEQSLIDERLNIFWGSIEDKNKSLIDLRIGNSHDLIPNIDDESIDIFFIDGAHDYTSVKKDIELSFPKVKTNGFICGDDYSGDYDDCKIKDLPDDLLEEDWITLPGYWKDTESPPNLVPEVHAGVVKAVYEFFNGDVMYNLPQSKWLHWKKGDRLGYNMGAYKNGDTAGKCMFDGEEFDFKIDNSHKGLEFTNEK